MRKNKTKKSSKISKKLIIAAIVSTAVFMIVSVTVFYTLFYRKSDTYEIMFPDLVGSYEEDIKPNEKFEIKKNYVFSDIYPKGVVISQSPNGLTTQKIPIGTTPVLTVNISLGKESFVMPDLTGKTPVEAQRILRQMQCKSQIVRIYDDSGKIILETVTGSYPEANQTLHVGDEVIIYIQTPRATQRFLLPDFIGLDIDDAIDLLSDLGVNYEIIEGFDSNASEWEVISQAPAPNVYIDKKTTVIITINSD